MEKLPFILVSPSTEEKGAEFYDYSLSLSQTYLDAVVLADGLPVVLPCERNPDPARVGEYVRRCDGVMVTGGDDIQPELYWPDVPADLRKTVGRNDPARDVLETLLIQEAFSQRKPLLAICRGYQLLNITLGGTLYVDIPSQFKSAVNHCQLKNKDRFVHEVLLEGDSVLTRIFKQPSIQVNSSHHQGVNKVGKGLRVTGRAPDGMPEVLELRPEEKGLIPYLLGVQFHPERLVQAHSVYIELFRSFTEACVLNRNEPTAVDSR